MIRKILCALLALTFAVPAAAQSTQRGDQSTSYVSNVIGDGSTTQGGVAAFFENGSDPTELADIASAFSDGTTKSSWIDTGIGARTPATGDNKLRIHCQPSHHSSDDPILAPGVNNGSHGHTFFGNTTTNENSTYATLRASTAGGTCTGGPLNRTAYWHMDLEVLKGGVYLPLKPDWYIIYYPSGDSSSAAKMSRLPRGMAYIGGRNPADMDNDAQANRIAAANAVAGYAKYAPALDTLRGDGVKGWRCETSNGANVNSPSSGNPLQPYLVTPGGLPTLTCPANERLELQLMGPRCMDGKNITSTNGRKHMIYPIRNTDTGQNVCPDGWYWAPDFNLSIMWPNPGDLTKVRLSSDQMNDPATAADPTAVSPCRQVSAYYCRGETAHFDWFGGWDYGTQASPGIMLQWMRDCSGIRIYPTISGNPGECNDSTFNASLDKLKTGTKPAGSTLSLNPVLSFPTRSSTTGAAYFTPTVKPGDMTVIHNH